MGDDYYCREWEKEMLASRQLNSEGIYVLNAEHGLYSLIYHAVVHKRKIANDYYEKVAALAEGVEGFDRQALSSPCIFDDYFHLLKGYMQRKGYRFTRPKDISVYYNRDVIHTEDVQEWMEKFGISEVEPIMINQYGNSGYVYYRGQREGRSVFIKWGGLGETCKEEFTSTKALYALDSDHFVQPHCFRCDGDLKFFVMDYEPGDTLEKRLEEGNISEAEREHFITELHRIALALHESHILHRDIRPANFILAKDGHLKLIDSQFAVDSRQYTESKGVRRRIGLIYGLGCEYAYGKFEWDDMYSIAKLMEVIGVPTSRQELYEEVKSRIGKMRVRLRLKYRLRWRFFRLLTCITPVRSWRRRLRQK